ncbi:MAG: hypothetical protein ABR520_01610 [Mycobacteriales bacterium]
MPKGVYHHLDDGGDVLAVERFSCAPGPAGWRYVGEVADPAGLAIGAVDVTCDAQWRPVRVEVRSGGWVVRGGVVGSKVVWLRLPAGAAADGEPEQRLAAVGFFGRSPAFTVAVARLLAMHSAERRTLQLVRLSGDALAVQPRPMAWAMTEVREHATETAPLVVERFEVDDLVAGERAVLEVAGDVVVDAPHLELAELESPPNQWARPESAAES